MSKTIYSGIDIGSQNIKIISVEYNDLTKKTKIIGNKSYLSRGVKNGYITNKTLFLKSLKEAIIKYKRDLGIEISEVVLTISSIDLKSESIKLIHLVENKKNLDDVDLLNIEKKIQKKIKIGNSYPLDLRLKSVKLNKYIYYSELKDLIGLDTKKIELDYVVIGISKNHFKIIEDLFNTLDIEILDINSGNLMSSEFNTTVDEKEMGFLSINIGAEVTSVSIWENNKIIYLEHFEFGGETITNIISLKKQIDFKRAEEMKIKSKIPKDILNEIENNEIEKLIEKIKAILIKLDLLNLLPAGIILYGGGAKNLWIREVIKEKMSMPVRNTKKFVNSRIDYNDIYSSVILYIKKDVVKIDNGFLDLLKKIKRIFKR